MIVTSDLQSRKIRFVLLREILSSPCCSLYVDYRMHLSTAVSVPSCLLFMYDSLRLRVVMILKLFKGRAGRGGRGWMVLSTL